MRSFRYWFANLALLAALSACGDVEEPVGLRRSPINNAMTALEVPPRSPPVGRVAWRERAAQEIWERSAELDSVVIVGLKEPGHSRGVWRNRVLVSDQRKSWLLTALEDAVPEAPIVRTDSILPVVMLKVSSAASIERIRSLGFVDYVEPQIRFVPASATKGCEFVSDPGPFRTLPDGDFIPPNYELPATDIRLAWLRAQGVDVVIGLADTGISPDQSQLLEDFDAGQSHSRTKSLVGVTGYPWYETGCSHGTLMAGAMVAPLDGANTVGVAWKSHFVSAHQADHVFSYWMLTWQTVEGIRLAASEMPQSARRIVTMAFQSEDYGNFVTDEIAYWHDHGRLFIGASGHLDYFGIAFPAELDDVVAVSAISSGFGELSEINYGDNVELSFPVSQLTTGRTGADVQFLEGSSGATAVVSGIAALIWSYYPQETNEQIRQRLRHAAHQYPNRDRVRGYGVPNPAEAIGLMTYLGVGAPYAVNVHWGPVNVTAGAMHNGDEPFSYSWTVTVTNMDGTKYNFTSSGSSVTVAFDDDTCRAQFSVVVSQGNGPTESASEDVGVYDESGLLRECSGGGITPY